MGKLAIWSVGFSAAVFIGIYLLPPGLYLYFAGACALAFGVAFLRRGKARRRFWLIAFALSLGFLVCFASFRLKTQPVGELDGKTLRIRAEITEIPRPTGYGASLAVKLRGDNVPSVNGVIYTYDQELPELKMGYIISLDARLQTSAVKNGKSFSGYTADNVFLIGYAQSDIEVVGKNPLSFLNFPKAIAANVRESALKVFSSDTSAFLIALLTGDTSLLYEDVQLNADMSVAGILHVVSVSGMHVAFLIGFLRLIVRRKKWSSLIGIPLVWLFVPLAGASPSVIRAAFMQSMVLAAPLLRRENDGITAIGTVLALLLLNPNACKSISLQLSFAAMLGIILVTPQINRYLLALVYGKKKKSKTSETRLKRMGKGLVIAIIASISASIGAMIFSTPIAALYFGFVPLYGILVNIIIFWAISAAFIFGYLACLLGLIWLPLGAALGAIASLLGRYVTVVAHGAAQLPYAAVYTAGNIFGLWLIFVYLLFIACYIFKGRGYFRPVIPICITVCTLCGLIIFIGIKTQSSPARLCALNVGEGQSIVVTQGQSTMVIDCGGRLSTRSAGDLTAAWLLSKGRQSVDILALTSLDVNSNYDLLRLMSRVAVKRVILPPIDKENRDAVKLLDILEKSGAEVYIINESTEIKIGDLGLLAYAPVSRTAPSLMYLASVGDFNCFISGGADQELEKRFVLTQKLPDCDVFVAGRNGSRNSNCEEILYATGAETAIISSGYNRFGHPALAAISRMEAAGMKIFRTDEIGDITIEMVN